MSFLLITFWTTRKEALIAGIKVMILNSIGDSLLLMGIVMLMLEC